MNSVPGKSLPLSVIDMVARPTRSLVFKSENFMLCRVKVVVEEVALNYLPLSTAPSREKIILC